MKRFWIFALALVLVLSMFACGKKAEPAAPTAEPTEVPETEKPFGPDALIGLWKVKTVEASGMTLDAAEVGIEVYFDFLEDGKNVHSWVRSASMTDDYTMAYEIEGFDIIFHDRSGDERGSYDPATDRIAFSQGDTTMYIERTAEEPQKESGIIGSWTLKTMEGEGMSFNAADLGMEMIFEFREDGTVAIASEGETRTETYTFADNAIVITDVSGDVQGAYDPAADTLAFEQDGVKLVFVRTGSEAAAVEPAQTTETKAVEITAEEAVGTWTLTKAIVTGMEVPASAMGTEMTFVFDANGTGLMIYNGSTTEGLSWTVAEGKLKLSAGTMELYDFVYDGTALILHETTTGTDMVFEKTAE